MKLLLVFNKTYLKYRGHDTFSTRPGTCEGEEYSCWGRIVWPHRSAFVSVFSTHTLFYISLYQTKTFHASMPTHIFSNIDAAANLRKMLPALVYSATPRND